MKNQNESSQSLNHLQKKTSKIPLKPISQSFILAQQVSCLQTYQNILYVGTNQSKVIVYEIGKSQSKQEPLVIKKVAQIYPHCTFVKFIVAVSEFVIVVPQEQQQLIRIWHRQSLLIMQGFKGHQKQITAVIFLKDGKHLASVSQDSTARIWDIYEHNQFDKQKFLFEGLYPLLTIEEIDQNILALGGDDCCITLWDWKKSQIQCVVFGHPGSVYSLTFYYPYLVSSGGDSQIKIWEIKQQSGTISSKTLADSSYQQKEQLNLIKEIPGQVGQNQFFIKLPNYRMLVLDSAGRLLSINDRLEVHTQLLKVEYYKKIISAKVWGEYLLFVSSEVHKDKKIALSIVSLGESKLDEAVSGFHLNNMINLLTTSININTKGDQSQEVIMTEEIEKLK